MSGLKRRSLGVVGVSLAVFLTGCVTISWEAHQKDAEARYLGQPLDAMYDEYGVPIGVMKKSDGGVFAEFWKLRGMYRCEAKVTTNPAGKIVKIKTGGQNGCVM